MQWYGLDPLQTEKPQPQGVASTMNTRERTLTLYALHVLVYAHVHLEGTSRRGPVKTGGTHVPPRTGNVGMPASGQMGTHVVPNRYLQAKKQTHTIAAMTLGTRRPRKRVRVHPALHTDLDRAFERAERASVQGGFSAQRHDGSICGLVCLWYCQKVWRVAPAKKTRNDIDTRSFIAARQPCSYL